LNFRRLWRLAEIHTALCAVLSTAASGVWRKSFSRVLLLENDRTMCGVINQPASGVWRKSFSCVLLLGNDRTMCGAWRLNLSLPLALRLKFIPRYARD